MSDILRTSETAKEYQAYLASGELDKICPLCEKGGGKTFKHWKISQNDYPYDAVATKHDMLLPTRHVTGYELNESERKELEEIKKHHLADYDYIMEATDNAKTIPKHFHLHLIVGKQR